MTRDEHMDITDEMVAAFRDIARGIGRVITEDEARRFYRWVLVTEKAARTATGTA
jgi:hypothetical protein